MKDRVTKELIETAPYKDLIAYCNDLDVKFTNQPKDELRALLLEAFEKLPKEEISVKNKNLHKKYGNDIYNIMRQKKLSKSDKMRALYDLGITKPAEIAKITKCHYSFVYGVIQRHKSG